MSSYVRLSSEHLAIRKYAVAGTGAKTMVRIEVEVSDPHELGWLLKSLADAQHNKAEEDAARKAAAQAEKRLAKTKPLALPFYGERS